MTMTNFQLLLHVLDQLLGRKIIKTAFTNIQHNYIPGNLNKNNNNNDA